MRYQRSSQLFKEAQEVLVGGVNSPVRAFKSVGGTPVFFDRAKGSILYDADGNEFIDYIGSWGPMIIGHSHPDVVQAIQKQAEKGTSFGAPTELENLTARILVDNIEGIDKVRFVNSGTEACMSAVRLARGFTGRDKIIKFVGCYHGHADSFLINAGSGAATFGVPNSPGVTQGTAKDTLSAIYNDLDSVKTLFKNNPKDIACIIVEPVAGNMGCILPENGFLKGLKALCVEHNALLIFDEVMTGFRLAYGGAQEYFGIQADLVTYGKIIGGGLPVGAFAARKEIMAHLAPEGPVYQAGTLSGNPLAMSAGLTTLKHLRENPDVYTSIDKYTTELGEKMHTILTENGITHQVNQIGSMVSVHFCEEPVVDFESASKGNNDTFNQFYHHMLDNGIYLPPSCFESWFIGNTLGDTELNKTLEAIRSFKA